MVRFFANSRFDLLTYLIQLGTMRLLTIREPTHHFMIESRDYVNMHMEDLLGSSSTV